MEILEPPRRARGENDLCTFLDSIGIGYTTVRHHPVDTVKASQAIRAALPKIAHGHCKNLFLRDKKRLFYLFITLENKRVNLNKLQKILGTTRLSFGRPDDIEKYLGVRPGSVTPFSAINPSSKNVLFVLDSRMLQETSLNYHPLHNEATTTISSQDLLLFLQHCGHLPKFVSI